MYKRVVFRSVDYDVALGWAQELSKGQNALVEIDPTLSGWEVTVCWT